ncbi:hypothetical protein D3C76_1691140 [compost metagenome]
MVAELVVPVCFQTVRIIQLQVLLFLGKNTVAQAQRSFHISVRPGQTNLQTPEAQGGIHRFCHSSHTFRGR